MEGLTQCEKRICGHFWVGVSKRVNKRQQTHKVRNERVHLMSPAAERGPWAMGYTPPEARRGLSLQPRWVGLRSVVEGPKSGHPVSVCGRLGEGAEKKLIARQGTHPDPRGRGGGGGGERARSPIMHCGKSFDVSMNMYVMSKET